jgi:hypothetical protein
MSDTSLEKSKDKFYTIVVEVFLKNVGYTGYTDQYRSEPTKSIEKAEAGMREFYDVLLAKKKPLVFRTIDGWHVAINGEDVSCLRMRIEDAEVIA